MLPIKSGLKNQVSDHLGRYANVPIDLSVSQDPIADWWRCGYALRNRVVHLGYKPSEADVEGARQAAYDAVAYLRKGLAFGGGHNTSR